MQIGRLPPEVEEPFRQGLDHAAKGRIGELGSLVDGLSEQQLSGVIGMCLFTAAYTAIDVCGRKWPDDASVREMAEHTASVSPEDKALGLTAQSVYQFISRCALSFEPLDEVFGESEEILTLPFVITVDFLAAFVPKELSIGQFLDMIEDAYEKAFILDLNLLPALMVRARMPQPEEASAAKGPDASDSSL
jgi:hypothetical protein